MNEIEGNRRSRAVWSWFKTNNKHVAIAHKSDRGFVDLTLYGKGEDNHSFKELISSMMAPEMSLIKTGNSLSIRLLVPIDDFQKYFDDQIEYLHESITAVDKLNELSKEINTLDFF